MKRNPEFDFSPVEEGGGGADEPDFSSSALAGVEKWQNLWPELQGMVTSLREGEPEEVLEPLREMVRLREKALMEQKARPVESLNQYEMKLLVKAIYIALGGGNEKTALRLSKEVNEMVKQNRGTSSDVEMSIRLAARSAEYQGIHNPSLEVELWTLLGMTITPTA